MLLYKYTDTEIKALIKTMVILVDTREQRNEHITAWLDANKIAYKEQKLDTGDYSCYLPQNEKMGISRDMYFTDIASIERKGSLNELSGNLTKDRNRLENELIRSKGRLYLLIENADYGLIAGHKYPTGYDPKAFIASLSTFQARYDIRITYMQKQEYSGSWIYNTLAYHVREYLKN